MDLNTARAGQVDILEPGVRRILAPNPSPMTYTGTNTYLVGEGDVAIIDPGPRAAAHGQAILDALRPGERITHLLVTHSHLDHSPLAADLAEQTGARVYAFGDSRAGRSAVMERLVAAGLTGGGEGVDTSFTPEETLGDGDTLTLGGIDIAALWTPGHMANHLCFAVGDAVFSGDLIMGWASTMVSPPDGDLTAFMASTERLAERDDRVLYPGHGAPISDPKGRAEWLLGHRRSREAQILAALTRQPKDAATLTAQVYTDVGRALLAAAERNVFAHLIDLVERGRAVAEPELSHLARFRIAE